MTTGYKHKHLLWFVKGALHEHISSINLPTEGIGFDMELHDTMTKAVESLRGVCTQLGSCANYQREICSEAKLLFQPQASEMTMRTHDRRQLPDRRSHAASTRRDPDQGAERRLPTTVAQVAINEVHTVCVVRSTGAAPA